MKSWKVRIAIAAAVLVVGAVAYTAMLPANEAVVISGPYVCSYYNNASFQKVVGARGVGCCGAPISWGHTTKYVRCEQLLCPDVVCPD